MRNVVIVGDPERKVTGWRTPIGCHFGALKSVPAPELMATCIAELIGKGASPAVVPPNLVEFFTMGQVLSAHQGQSPSRIAALLAGLPESCGSSSVEMVCGSGSEAVAQAYMRIACGISDCVIAGGVENMSRGAITRLSEQVVPLGTKDPSSRYSTMHDGLKNPKIRGSEIGETDEPMGILAEAMVKKWGFTLEELVQFSVESYEWAQAAVKGRFKTEVVPVAVKDEDGKYGSLPIMVEEDEEPFAMDIDADVRRGRPAFGGFLSAGTSSKINDGASAVVLADEEFARANGLKPVARIKGYATFAKDPRWFTEAPLGALAKLFEATGIKAGDRNTDMLYEINEAFSNVVLAVLREYHIRRDIMNVNGGAIALGHPIGCSGNRILVTLLGNMIERGVSRGIAGACIGGGRAVAMLVERC